MNKALLQRENIILSLLATISHLVFQLLLFFNAAYHNTASKIHSFDHSVSPTKIMNQSAIVYATTRKMVGSAGFEPAASSAQGWHHTKLDNDPFSFSLRRKFSQSECNFNLMNKLKPILLLYLAAKLANNRYRIATLFATVMGVKVPLINTKTIAPDYYALALRAVCVL
jgi:hypothetical protein